MKVDDRREKVAPAPAEADPPKARRPLWSFADLGRTPRLGSHKSIHGGD